MSQQLEEAHTAMQDETRNKLALQAKLRASEEEKNSLQQDMEDLEDLKLAAEKDKMLCQQQVRREQKYYRAGVIPSPIHLYKFTHSMSFIHFYTTYS